MKRMLLLFIFITLISFFSGCSDSKQNPIVIKETNSIENKNNENINFEVEQVVLSQGFQNIEPNVEIIKKVLDFRLLASLGLVESSGVNVTKINKIGNDINIFVENETDTEKKHLSVPQILIDLKGVRIKNKEDLTFNIINENYTPIKVKLGINEVVNKINSDFKISINTFPMVNILNKNDRILWELNYNNIFDKYNTETPIIDLSVLIDANSGSVIKSSKNFISSLIDEGYILDYIPNKFILYKKQENGEKNNGQKETLWVFDIEDNHSEILYSSKSKICCAKFSPDATHISILESSDENNELYVMEKQDKKAYKVLFKDYINPKIIRWKDKENLYIVDKNKDRSYIYFYNVEENETNLFAPIPKDIVDLQIMDDYFLITEGNEDKKDIKIYLTENFSQFEFDSHGFKPSFINENKIAFLKFNEKKDSNIFTIYDLDKNRYYDTLNLNITKFFSLDDENLALIEKKQSEHDFTLYKYNIRDKELTSMANINSDNVYYNDEKKFLYVNLSVPFESEKSQIVYALNLMKVANIEP